MEYTEPGQRKDLRHVVRKEKALERAGARAPAAGFTTGFDLFSEVSRYINILHFRTGRSAELCQAEFAELKSLFIPVHVLITVRFH